MFVRTYKEFIDKSGKSVDDLYYKLEAANRRFLDKARDSRHIKDLYIKRKKSEKKGDIIEADKTKIPKYFIFNQVISDIKVFISQILSAVIEFYSVLVQREKLENIQEELMESIINLTLRGKMHQVVFSFFKLEAEDRRELLIKKYKEFLEVKPEHVGIDERFALNSSSPLIQIYDIMIGQSTRINASIAGSRPFASDEDSGSDKDSDGDEPNFRNTEYHIKIEDAEVNHSERTLYYTTSPDKNI